MLPLPLLLLLAAPPPTPAAATNQAPAPVEPAKGWFRPGEVEKGCVARAIALPAGITASGTLKVRFVVWTDGTADRVELPGEVSPLVAEAITAAVKGCRFTPGRRPDGARAPVWTVLPLRFVDEAGAGGEKPAGGAPPATAAMPAAGTPPREADPGCVQKQFHFRFPPNQLLRGVLVMRVAMSAEGRPGAFEFPPDLPGEVADAFKLSVEGCRFLPAAAPGGQAVAGTFEHRVVFTLPGDAERAAGTGPKLKREARLASTTCLQRLHPYGMVGHAVVAVKVTARGVPTDFRLKPDNVPADMRLHIFDVLTTCKWEPAIGPDDQPVDGDTVVTIRYR